VGPASIVPPAWALSSPFARPSTTANGSATVIDDGAGPQQTTERDFRVLTACTLAFLDFFERHRRLFRDEDPETAKESFTAEGLEVTLTAPFAWTPVLTAEQFFTPPPAPAKAAVGRNDPCPCGSGKKFKKCHLAAEGGTPGAARAESVHEMDHRLVEAIGQFARRRFGTAWLNDAKSGPVSLPLFVPWVAWTATAGGKRIAQWYLEQHESTLGVHEREWFAAQERSWLGIWEATAVRPGTVEVRDLLTGQRRTVDETMASRSLVARDTVLARVIDFHGRSLFGGLHERSLPPREAAEVVQIVRAKLRMRSGEIAVERLQDPAIGRFLMDWWGDSVLELDERASKPPILQNTDGDPLLLVADAYSFDAAQRAEIENRILSMDEVDGVDRRKNETAVTFARSRDLTVIGRVFIGRDALRIETNSERRAAALARRLRDACGELLRAGERTTEEPPTALTAQAHEATKPRPRMSAREEALLAEVKEAHYRNWIDHPIPALGGRPRAPPRARRRDASRSTSSSVRWRIWRAASPSAPASTCAAYAESSAWRSEGRSGSRVAHASACAWAGGHAEP
jgi:hypothetical protein